jgi:hypothetical protein
MHKLRHIWQDIRRGENIDLYVTVLIAIGLAGLNLLGLAPQAWLAPLTLAVLGLLAVATLGNRYRLEESLNTLNQTHSGLFQEKLPAALEADMEKSREMWLVGVTLNRTLNTHFTLLEKKLSRGDRVRVLLVHPEGPSAEMLAMREYRRYTAERIRSLIRDSLSDLCHLQATYEKLEIRVVAYPLSFGGVVINPESASGILYLEHYPFKTPGGSQPKFVLEAKDGRWYHFFKLELETIWQNSTPWACHKESG